MNIEQYIKELSLCQMIIAITEPLRAERRVLFLRDRANQEHFARSTKNGYVLTDWGRWKAKEVLQTLRDDVFFFLEHLAQFQNLCVNYESEYNRLEKLLEESQSRRRIAVHWHDQAVLFKQTRRLEEKRDWHYRTMYESEFGSSARFLPYSTVQEFMEGVSIQTEN